MTKLITADFSGTGGSIKGTTYQRIPGAYESRQKTRKTFGNSNAQQFYRNQFSYTTRSWKTVLSASARTNWDNYAARITYVTGLPPYEKIKGINHYVRQSMFVSNFGGPGNIGADIGSGATQINVVVLSTNIIYNFMGFGASQWNLTSTIDQATSANALIGVYFWTDGNANVRRYPSKLPIVTQIPTGAHPPLFPNVQNFIIGQQSNWAPGISVPMRLVAWDNGNMSQYLDIMVPII